MKRPKNPILRLFIPFALCVSALLFQSCDEPPEHILRVYLTSGSLEYGARTQQITMPMSGAQVNLYKQPILMEGDIVNIELARIELGLGLLLQVSELGQRQLYRTTVSNMGESLILFINNKPVGVRQIDYAIQDGQFFTFVEMSDEKLIELFPKLKESVKRAQELKD